MQELKALQTAFIKTLQDQKNTPCIANLRPYCGADQDNFATGFWVYHNNFVGTATNSLKNHYPVTAALLGDAEFKALSLGYLHAFPSNFFSLNEFGKSFSDFVQEMLAEQSLADTLPFLRDLTRVEWAIHRILLGPENQKFNFGAFSEIEEAERENIVFHLAENSFYFSSFYPIQTIWETGYHTESGQESAEFAFDDMENLTSETPFYFWIQRKNFLLSMIQLTVLQWEMIEHLSQGLTLKEIQHTLSQSISTPALECQQAVIQLIEMGVITHFSCA